jgi:hypothetical protein
MYSLGGETRNVGRPFAVVTTTSSNRKRILSEILGKFEVGWQEEMT